MINFISLHCVNIDSSGHKVQNILHMQVTTPLLNRLVTLIFFLPTQGRRTYGQKGRGCLFSWSPCQVVTDAFDSDYDDFDSDDDEDDVNVACVGWI